MMKHISSDSGVVLVAIKEYWRHYNKSPVMSNLIYLSGIEDEYQILFCLRELQAAGKIAISPAWSSVMAPKSRKV